MAPNSVNSGFWATDVTNPYKSMVWRRWGVVKRGLTTVADVSRPAWALVMVRRACTKSEISVSLGTYRACTGSRRLRF